MFDLGASEEFLPLQQSQTYAAAVASCGARVRWLEGETGPILAVERGLVRLISRAGIGSGDAPVRCHTLRALARWPGITVATPETAVAGFGLVPLVTPMHHAIWCLAPDLRAGMARNWRGHLRQAERAGLGVRRGDARTMETLIRLEAVQRAKRRYRALPEGFTRALPPGALRLWEWRQAGAAQAAMCFVVHGGAASYHLGWGSDTARAAGVHQLMLTRAAEDLRAEGVRWLDLGSVDTEQAPGLARFKLGTGADLRRLGATCLVLP